MIPLYSKVQLISNDYQNQGAERGMQGYIIEIYDCNNYEIEFSDPKTGITLAQIVTTEKNLLLCSDDGA